LHIAHLDSLATLEARGRTAELNLREAEETRKEVADGQRVGDSTIRPTPRASLASASQAPT